MKGQKAETSKVTYTELLPQQPLQTDHNDVAANGATVRPPPSSPYTFQQGVSW